MTSQVELYNIAIGRIGIGLSVSAVDERTEQARQCQRFYTFCRRKFLRNHPHAFARKAAQLALLDQTYPGYGYVYDYPNSCITLLEVIPEEGLRWNRGAILSCDWSDRDQLAPQRIAYERILRTDGQAQAIATDLSDAWAIFTIDVSAIDIWPEDAVDALAWYLAAEVAGPLKAAPAMAQRAMDMAEVHRQRAGGNDMNEGYPDPEPDGPSVMARL